MPSANPSVPGAVRKQHFPTAATAAPLDDKKALERPAAIWLTADGKQIFSCSGSEMLRLAHWLRRTGGALVGVAKETVDEERDRDRGQDPADDEDHNRSHN